MKRLTKILATIGPASDSEVMIEKLIQAGVNTFRFNFKHNSVGWHDGMIERVAGVAKKMNVRVGLLIDLQGPEIRIDMPGEEMTIKTGELLTLGPAAFKEGTKGFSISHPEIIPHLDNGQKIVVDDGAFEFVIVKKGKKYFLKSRSNGVLKQRKSMNIPGADFPFPVLIDRDYDGLKLAKKREVDYVALSFVRSREDVIELKKVMKRLKLKAKIVSKIECKKALDELGGVVEESDGVMVARGDLGVELPVEQGPYYQKKIIKKCLEKGRFVITATQMLLSMVNQPKPTRAEVSDVANASYDLTDATMLSEESAVGNYPLESVRIMSRTLRANETKFFFDTRTQYDYEWKEQSWVVSNAAYDLYFKMKQRGLSASGFVVFTHSGRTARMLSGLRPNVPIFAFCPDSRVAGSLLLEYAVTPIVKGKQYKRHMRVEHHHVLAGVKFLKDKSWVKKGEKYICLYGDFWAEDGGTSTVKLIEVD